MEKKKSTRKKTTTAIVPVRHEPSISVDPQALVEAAIKQGAGIEIIQQLLDVRERLHKEAAEIAFREAMAEFQRECPTIVKSTGVDYTSKSGGRVKYQYASLDIIVATVRDILSRHGFSYTFTTAQTEKSVTAQCHVHHVAGHTETTAFTLPFDDTSKMNAMQTVASSLTYAKRYAFCNGFGIMTGEQDNDGNTHVSPAKREEKVDADKWAAEAREKMKALPENIKKGFELLGYKSRAVWEFCNSREWDNDRIYADINKIIDRQATK